MGPQQRRLFKYKWAEEGGGVARGGNTEETPRDRDDGSRRGRGTRREGGERREEKEKEKENQVPYLLIHSNSQIFCFPNSNT